MLYHQKPADFSPKIEVVSCFLEHGGKFLLLKRDKERPQGETWGMPAGKLEKGETPTAAMIRELREETGLTVEPQALKYFGQFFVRYKDFDFVCHIFSTAMPKRPIPVLDPREHSVYAFVTPVEALGYNLIEDEDSCIKIFYNL